MKNVEKVYGNNEKAFKDFTNEMGQFIDCKTSIYYL